MLTAAITAAVAFIARLLGVTLSASTLVGVAVGVKITLVLLGMVFGARLLRWREAQRAAAAGEPAKPVDTAAPALPGPVAPGNEAPPR